MKRWQRIAKDVFDRTTALVALLMTLPLFLFAAVVIKTFSRGPIFFKQERIGYRGRPFMIYKFRTMHIDAEDDPLGNVTVQDDPRVFFGARLLRKWNIDELPQLFNVLKGDMSLVGPRPTVQSDCRRMNPQQLRRHDVKPGITGTAQIRGGAALPWPLRIEFDLWYIEHQSLRLDLSILMQTALLVVLGRASHQPVTGDEWDIDPPHVVNKKTDQRHFRKAS